MIDGVKLTFPTPNDVGKDLVFRARTASITHSIEPGALSGGSGIIGLATNLASNQDVQGEGKRQQGRIDTGGGPHTTTIRLRNWKGSSDRWGATDGSAWDAGGADPRTQLQVLDNALRSIKLDSTAPLVLETGEYSSSGRFDPIDTAPTQSGLEFDVDEDVSTFRGELSLVDVISLQQAIDMVEQKT
jgi:hypothetical protein